MGTNFEDIFDQAVSRLQAGSSIEKAVSQWPEHRQELMSLLKITESLNSLPKKTVPQPALQRKYLLMPAKRLWFAWIHVSRFAAISAGAVLLFTALAGTGYAAWQSNPGQTLFLVKKTAEQARLKLTTDPVNKANFQMAITKKRLNEAEQVFKNPGHDSKQEVAALNELTQETKNTLEAVSQVTKVAPLPAKGHPVIASLENLAKEQQALLQEIKPKSQNPAADSGVKQAAEANAAQVASVERYLEIASAEQFPANLNKDPNAITAPGSLNEAANPATTREQAGEVKGETTETASSTASSTNASSASSTLQNFKKSPKGSETEAVPTSTDASAAVGAFILEDPKPQAALK